MIDSRDIELGGSMRAWLGTLGRKPMISEETYWPKTPAGWSDVIETFSPFDQMTIAALTTEARDLAVRSCLLRVACLLSYHGKASPGAFIADLGFVSLSEVGLLMATYLDNGAASGPRAG